MSDFLRTQLHIGMSPSVETHYSLRGRIILLRVSVGLFPHNGHKERRQIFLHAEIILERVSLL